MTPFNDSTQRSALESLVKGRTELAETRLAVTATQIVERMTIRASHLKQLMDEELSLDNRTLAFRELPFDKRCDLLGLETLLIQRSAQIKSDRRRENTECWRDLAHVMRDFLNAWEGFSRNEAKNRFLSALPASQAMQSEIPISTPPQIYHNDNQNIPYNNP